MYFVWLFSGLATTWECVPSEQSGTCYREMKPRDGRCYHRVKQGYRHEIIRLLGQVQSDSLLMRGQLVSAVVLSYHQAMWGRAPPSIRMFPCRLIEMSFNALQCFNKFLTSGSNRPLQKSLSGSNLWGRCSKLCRIMNRMINLFRCDANDSIYN